MERILTENGPRRGFLRSTMIKLSTVGKTSHDHGYSLFSKVESFNDKRKLQRLDQSWPWPLAFYAFYAWLPCLTTCDVSLILVPWWAGPTSSSLSPSFKIAAQLTELSYATIQAMRHWCARIHEHHKPTQFRKRTGLSMHFTLPLHIVADSVICSHI